MKRLQQPALILVFALIAATAFAQTRGDGRLAGKVVDDQGQPVQDVQVKATMKGQTQAMQGKTNKKGEWVINGLAGGEWDLEFTKQGLDTQTGSVTVDESGRTPTITVTMPKHVERVDPAVELNAAAQKGTELLQQQKYVEARKVFEDLLAKYPDIHQLHVYIAQTYAGENNIDKAIEHMKIASDKDPANAELKLVLADLMMEKGDKAGALEIMKSVDLTKIKNPLPLINASISLINEKRTDEALDILNKVAAQFPAQAETYYYRGRAYVAANKNAEAKADLEKFVSMAAPDARELPDAKKILEQLKDIK